MFISIGGLLIRLCLFVFKIACACLFVMMLQMQIGHQSLEQWIEQGLQKSALSRHLKRSAQAGMEVMNKKFFQMKGLPQNKTKNKNPSLKWQSELTRQLEDSVSSFNKSNNHRLPASQKNESQADRPAGNQ